MNDNPEHPVAGLRPVEHCPECCASLEPRGLVCACGWSRKEPPEPYDPPLVALPGAKVSPEVLLHRTINKLGRIKNVVVVIQWDDDTVDVDWSTMMQSELCMAEKVLSMAVTDAINSGS